MKILIILHKAKKKGGMVLQFLKMTDEFKKKGHKVHIFSFDSISNYQNPIKNYYYIYRSLKDYIHKLDPTLIFTSDPFITSLLAIFANKNRYPIVLRVGAVFHLFYSGRILEKINSEMINVTLLLFFGSLLKSLIKIIFKKIDLIIFNSNFLKELYKNEAKNSIVIYNGVELQERDDLSVNFPIKLIYIGRIEPRKSIELIIKSLRIMKSKGLNFTFSLVGKLSMYPKYWEKICNLVELHGLWDNLVVHDEIANYKLPGLLKEHDILLFSTDDRNFPITEGLPNVILEGMANGLAIIATHVAGVPEIIKEKNGFVVKPDPQIFAEKIEMLYNNKDLLLKIKENNIAAIKENFQIEKTSDNYLRVFHALTNK